MLVLWQPSPLENVYVDLSAPDLPALHLLARGARRKSFREVMSFRVLFREGPELIRPSFFPFLLDAAAVARGRIRLRCPDGGRRSAMRNPPARAGLGLLVRSRGVPPRG